MARRQTPGRREQAERPEAATPDAEEVGTLPMPIPEPVEGTGVVGLAVEDIGTLPLPLPEPPGEPMEGTVGEPPVLLAREPDTAESALDIGTLPTPVPEPAGAVGMDPDPVNMTASGLGEIATLPTPTPEPFQVEEGFLGEGEEPPPPDRFSEDPWPDGAEKQE